MVKVIKAAVTKQTWGYCIEIYTKEYSITDLIKVCFCYEFADVDWGIDEITDCYQYNVYEYGENIEREIELFKSKMQSFLGTKNYYLDWE